MSSDSTAGPAETRRRLLFCARQFSEAGYRISLSDTELGLELVATLARPGRCHAFARLAQDGRVEVRLTVEPEPSEYQVALLIINAATQLADVAATVTAIRPDGKRPFESRSRYDVPVVQSAGATHVTGAPDRLAEQDRGIDASPQHEAADARLNLRERLEKLPAGHPSSPYETDGSTKPSPPDLSERELPLPEERTHNASPERPSVEDRKLEVPRLTDAEYADHVQLVRDRLSQAHADGRATDTQYTVDSRHEVWSKDRRVLHDQLIDDLYQGASDVPCDGRAIIAGGLPGAGKTTVLEKHANIDRSKYLTINPDDIKEEMAQRGLIPEIEGLSPMEASDLAHEESSHIAKMLAFRAYGDQKNLIWDITMSSLDSTSSRIQDLRDNFYIDIEGVFVDLPPERSADRAISRHRNGHDEYRAGDGYGGRYIATEKILLNSDAEFGSINKKTFEAVKTLLDTWSIYDNSVDGRPAILLDSSHLKEKNDR